MVSFTWPALPSSFQVHSPSCSFSPAISETRAQRPEQDSLSFHTAPHIPFPYPIFPYFFPSRNTPWKNRCFSRSKTPPLWVNFQFIVRLAMETIENTEERHLLFSGSEREGLFFTEMAHFLRFYCNDIGIPRILVFSRLARYRRPADKRPCGSQQNEYGHWMRCHNHNLK